MGGRILFTLAIGVMMTVAGNDLINKGLNQLGNKRRHN